MKRNNKLRGYLLLWFESVLMACWVLQHQHCWLPPPWIHNPPRGSNLSLLHASSVQAQNQELGLKNLELRCVFFFFFWYFLLRHISQSVSNKYKKNISQTSEVHQTENGDICKPFNTIPITVRFRGINWSSSSTCSAIIVDIARRCLCVTMLFYTQTRLINRINKLSKKAASSYKVTDITELNIFLQFPCYVLNLEDKSVIWNKQGWGFRGMKLI